MKNSLLLFFCLFFFRSITLAQVSIPTEWLPTGAQTSDVIYRQNSIFVGWHSFPSIFYSDQMNIMGNSGTGILFTHDIPTNEAGRWRIFPTYGSNPSHETRLSFIHTSGKTGGFSLGFDGNLSTEYFQDFTFRGSSLRLGFEDVTDNPGNLWIRGGGSVNATGGNILITGGISSHSLGGKVIIDGGKGVNSEGEGQLSPVEIGSAGSPVIIGSADDQPSQITRIYGKAVNTWLVVGQPENVPEGYEFAVTGGTSLYNLNVSGNVGIGIGDVAPDENLHVGGRIKANGLIINDQTNAGKIFSLNSSGQSEWIEPSSFVPALNGQANSLAKFNGTGGVMESRIFDEQGTTDRVSVFAPEFLVSGQSTLQGVVQAQVVNISNTPISNPLLQSKQLQLGRDMSVHDFGNNGMIGKNWFWSGTGSERVTLNKGASQINMSEDGGIQMYTADDNDDLNTTGPRMVISNNGNIGVGTFDPVSALQVQRSVAGGTTFAENNLLQLSNRYNSDGGQTTEVTATFDNGELNPTGWKIGAGVTGNDYFRIRSFTNNTEIERMRIDNQGNVGIGVPAPSQRLDVDGTIRATGLILDNTNLTNGLAVLNNGILETLTNDELATTLATTSTPETIPMFGTNNLLTNSVIRQTPAGFVGINTINPVTTLDVNGVITATNLSLPGLNTTTGIRLLGIDETGQLVAPADPVLLTTLGGSGINATTGTGGRIAKYQGTGPDAALGDAVMQEDIVGNVHLGQFPATEISTAVANIGAKLLFDGGIPIENPGNNYRSDNSDPLWIARYNKDKNRTHLRINIGDDGINYAAGPTVLGAEEDKLSIGSYAYTDENQWNEAIALYSNGSIYAHKVKVSLDAYPDYVFAPNYKIRSLEETEAYIKANQHLPEMPSACEIEQNGADLGELHKAMLKQLEELTLQVIALKKEVEVLKKYK